MAIHFPRAALKELVLDQNLGVFAALNLVHFQGIHSGIGETSRFDMLWPLLAPSTCLLITFSDFTIFKELFSDIARPTGEEAETVASDFQRNLSGLKQNDSENVMNTSVKIHPIISIPILS